MRRLAGHCRELGATPDAGGVNFALWARLATRVELLLFATPGDCQPEIITLHPQRNRTAYYWHIYLEGLPPGQLYGYRIDGPRRPAPGSRFDANKVLLDPYGRQVLLGPDYDRQAAARPGDNLSGCAKSVVIDLNHYDWEDDCPPRHPLSRAIIYELHVGGFTRHTSSGVAPPLRGSYLGLIEKIPYLQQLGITTVQLLPVFQFDPQDAPAGKRNYWGYNPISFFAPHDGYASHPHRAVDEFRDMVKALHRAHIAVILDVVYTHSAEGDNAGPSLCFRGIDNDAYYLLTADGRSNTDYSGCGNTLKASHPVTGRLILDSLRYWHQQMHVDGFRLDLAAMLALDEQGQLQPRSALLNAIDTDPMLADCTLIAEAWLTEEQQQASLTAGRWRVWNSNFRDDVRRFIKGDPHSSRALAWQMLGNPDHPADQTGRLDKYINFVTSHDGFTLWDLVSYNQKHNQLNGEQNRDGQTENFSWNHGQEGDSDDPAILALRLRQSKNLSSALLLAFGTPMLLMGDEVLRSQQGNNNGYCQDNPLSWMPWEWEAPAREMQRFVQELIRYRRQLFRGHQAGDQLNTLHELLQQADIGWHGVEAHSPDWRSASHSLAFSARSRDPALACYLIFNAGWEPLLFNLPLPLDGGWQRVLDTGLPAPDDIVPQGEPLPKVGDQYRVEARSVCLFICQP